MRRGTTIKSDDYSEDDAISGPLRLRVPMAAAGTRLDLMLAGALPQFSRSRLQAWIEAGLVVVDDVPPSVRQKVRGGETIEVRPRADGREVAFDPEPIALDIVHEDAALIVVNKPPGLVAHPAAGNWSGTLLNALLHHAPALSAVPRAGIVHRLDKDTSGLLVVAKTLEAQTALVRQLQARSVRREYWALVAGRVEASGRIEAAVGRHPSQRTRMAVLHADASGAKPAVTHFKVIRGYARAGVPATLIECRLETGRTHQIRVHMQHVGHPLVGDQTYGHAPHRGWFHRQALHARRLAIEHPVSGAHLAWQAPLPADMNDLLKSLEKMG